MDLCLVDEKVCVCVCRMCLFVCVCVCVCVCVHLLFIDMCVFFFLLIFFYWAKGNAVVNKLVGRVRGTDEKIHIFSLSLENCVTPNVHSFFFFVDRSGTDENYTEKDQLLDGAVELYKNEEDKKNHSWESEEERRQED